MYERFANRPKQKNEMKLTIHLSEHARFEAETRSVTVAEIEATIQQPDETLHSKFERFIYQKVIVSSNGKPYLIRVVAEKFGRYCYCLSNK